MKLDDFFALADDLDCIPGDEAQAICAALRHGEELKFSKRLGTGDKRFGALFLFEHESLLDGTDYQTNITIMRTCLAFVFLREFFPDLAGNDSSDTR
jgi:hypothetical protein